MKAYESSTAMLCTLLAHPSLQCDAVERAFDTLADANADVHKLDNAMCSGMDLAVGVSVSLEDEDEINTELTTLVADAEAKATVAEKEKVTQRTAPPEDLIPVQETYRAQLVQERTHMDTVAKAEPVTKPVLAR